MLNGKTFLGKIISNIIIIDQVVSVFRIAICHNNDWSENRHHNNYEDNQSKTVTIDKTIFMSLLSWHVCIKCGSMCTLDEWSFWVSVIIP